MASINLVLSAILGTPNTGNISVANFTSPLSWTASFGVNTVVSLAASTSNIAVNLATLFPGLANCTFIYMREVSATPLGFQVGSNSTGTRHIVRPSGIFAYTPDPNVVPPTIYFNNVTGAILQVEIGLLGS